LAFRVVSSLNAGFKRSALSFKWRSIPQMVLAQLQQYLGMVAVGAAVLLPLGTLQLRS
jgi:hypothetical protein